MDVEFLADWPTIYCIEGRNVGQPIHDSARSLASDPEKKDALILALLDRIAALEAKLGGPLLCCIGSARRAAAR
jgi:hypothetical protein